MSAEFLQEKVYELSGSPRRGISNTDLIPILSLNFAKFTEETRQNLFTEQDLLRQICLHFHRFNTGYLSEFLLSKEIRRLSEKLFYQRQELPREYRKPSSSTELKQTKLKPVDPSVAHIIHKTHHYLGSVRNDGFHLGLFLNEASKRSERLMSLVTLSPFDLSHISDHLPEEARSENVLVLSRLFAFNWCPRNTVSFTLGRVFEWVRENLPYIKMVITYLNPNLGFYGSVYSATNWKLFALEKKERYLYFDGDYATDREMIDSYGTAKFEKLRVKLGDRIARSINPLQPLKIYSYFLDGTLRKKYAEEPVHELLPNTRLV